MSFSNVKSLSLLSSKCFSSALVLLGSKYKITQHLIEPAIFSPNISFIYLLHLRYHAVYYPRCCLHLDPFQRETDVSNGFGDSISELEVNFKNH